MELCCGDQAVMQRIVLLSVVVAALASSVAAGELDRVIRDVQPKIVKIHGAGGYRGLEPYQSGFLFSPDGHVLTVWSYVLDTDYITAVLDDGRHFDAKLVAADPRHHVDPVEPAVQSLRDSLQQRIADRGT